MIYIYIIYLLILFIYIFIYVYYLIVFKVYKKKLLRVYIAWRQ